MTGKDILRALARLEEGQEALRSEVAALGKQVEALEGGSLDDARLQQGLDNILAFDGKVKRGGGV